jgi:short-subunit dehydrogenase involved in D-alanine esterification of teichoic acids
MRGEKKVALITGSSSGIGLETAILLARSGFHTYASMRNLEKSKNITEIANIEKNLPLTVVQLDVNDDRSVKDTVGKIIREKGRIDVLVNNAGYGLFSPIEDVTLDQVKEQFETNFFGLVRVTKEVLPIMRKQRKGTIVSSSPPKLVADAILDAITSKEPEIRYLVGDDAKSIMEVRKNSSDKEFENWMYERMLQEKGFVRANTVKVGSI